MNESILIVEDEIALAETIKYNLEREGYRTTLAMDGQSGLNLAIQIHPDLVILDIMLPKIDGLEVCKQVRKTSAIPIMMVTARSDEIDKVVGLEVGADDYITKPFSMREFIARVKALLRRSNLAFEKTTPNNSPQVSNDLVINKQRHEVISRGEILKLSPREFDLITFFSENKRRVISREEILNKVWGWDYLGNSRTVDVHVRGLRQKLEVDPDNPKRIITVHGEGYIFEG